MDTGEKKDKRLNIIFLMTDQHRLDHVGYHGRGVVPTPNLDRIAESVGFTACQTANPICTPARTALLAGKYTHQIGTLAMSGDLSLQHPTYLRALRKAGYHTSGIGKFHFLQTWKWGAQRGTGIDLVGIKEEMKKYGFDFIWETSGKQLSRQNYCDYCAYLDGKGLLEKYRDFVDSAVSNSFSVENENDDQRDGEPSPLADEDYVDVMTADAIIDRIRRRPEDKPFFIFGSFCSPHKPMDPPQSYLDQFPLEAGGSIEGDAEDLDASKGDFITGGKKISEENLRLLYKKRRAYKAMVKLVDDQVGRIFSTLEAEGLLENTLILFTSDHGEMMGDHLKLQKMFWYKESVCVPAAIRHPGYLGKKVNHSPVELTDLTATILDAAGLDPQRALSKDWPAFHDRVPCRSLLPIVRGETEQVRDFAFSECNGEWQMIFDGRWKYVRHLRYEAPGKVREELYDTKDDPDELKNRATDPSCAPALARARESRDWVMDSTPPAQTRWAPLHPEGEAYSYPE